jgi:hypothetical protein
MGTFETKLAVMFGLAVLKKLLESDEDTSELEEAIAAADSEEAIEEIVVSVAVDKISDVADPEVEEVVKELIESKSVEKVQEVMVRPGIISGIVDLLGNLLGLIFGKTG